MTTEFFQQTIIIENTTWAPDLSRGVQEFEKRLEEAKFDLIYESTSVKIYIGPEHTEKTVTLVYVIREGRLLGPVFADRIPF